MNQHDQMREALRKLKSEERVRTFAEAQYWLNQYRLFAEQLLAVEPAPAKLSFCICPECKTVFSPENNRLKG